MVGQSIGMDFDWGRGVVRNRGNVTLICSVLIAALTGCAYDYDSGKGTVPSQAAAGSGVSNQGAGRQTSELLQSSSERQLVVAFIALLEMDKKADLHITSPQAERILPIVNAAIEHGLLAQTDRQELLEVLDTVQQAYYEEVSGRMKKRAAAMKHKQGRPLGPPLTEEERQALAKDLEQRRLIEPKDQDGNRPIPSPFREPPPVDSSLDKNVEQQLVELLESKLSPP